MTQSGWIFDAYPVAEGMRVWMVDDSGRAFYFLDRWHPHFYFAVLPSKRIYLEKLLGSFRTPVTLEVTERKDFYSHEPVAVIRVTVGNPLLYKKIIDQLITLPDLTLFDADMNLVQVYFYERDLFPLAFCSVDTDLWGEVKAWDLKDSCWTIDYPLPPLRFAHLSLDSAPAFKGEGEEDVNPNHSRRGAYLLTLGRERGVGTSFLMDDSEENLIASLNRHIREWDPDILLTDWGDSFLLPRLRLYSQRSKTPLNLSRDPERTVSAARARSFFSYGKIVHRAGSNTLFGRLHIDTQNSFTQSHTELEGLFEVSRVAKIPLQRAARVTIGTLLSSMQHNWAVKNGYLIPLDKGQTEAFRSAEDLIASDRGGLVYEPEIGWHEDLIEFDFVSMYPEIMIRHNITPEAINCACCPENIVPELRHHICRRRIGMIPQVLRPIVDKRRAYKTLVKEGHPKAVIFKRRADAFKWALVTCFGYLGFRNARFGRIEAHECVNAFSRDILLHAKEIAEGEGFHFVHGIVDCLWLKKPGATVEEVERVRRKIEEATEIPLGFEGRYRWVRFCASEMNPRVGVPNRYFGVFGHGELKIRGIELRRHDTPLFIKNFQQAVLGKMAEASDLNDLKRLEPELRGILADYEDRLKTGQVTPLELAIRMNLSKEPGRYKHDTLSALAAKKLEASGLKLSAGESIQYVVAEEHDKVKDWRVMPLALIEDNFEYDRKFYERLLRRAAGILPFALEEEPIPAVPDDDLFTWARNRHPRMS